MNNLLKTLAFFMFPAVAAAAIVYIDDTAVGATTLVDVSATSNTLTNDPSNSTIDTSMPGMALFTDTASGVSYYRVPVSGLSGDTVRFGIQVSGPDGLSSPSDWFGTHTDATLLGVTARDVLLMNSGSFVGGVIDLAADPFAAGAPPAGVGSTTGAVGPAFSNLSFSAPSNFDTVLIRAEFFGSTGGFNGNESKLFGVIPEPSRALLLGLSGLALAIPRRRR